MTLPGASRAVACSPVGSDSHSLSLARTEGPAGWPDSWAVGGYKNLPGRQSPPPSKAPPARSPSWLTVFQKPKKIYPCTHQRTHVRAGKWHDSTLSSAVRRGAVRHNGHGGARSSGERWGRTRRHPIAPPKLWCGDRLVGRLRAHRFLHTWSHESRRRSNSIRVEKTRDALFGKSSASASPSAERETWDLSRLYVLLSDYDPFGEERRRRGTKASKREGDCSLDIIILKELYSKFYL